MPGRIVYNPHWYISNLKYVCVVHELKKNQK